jgi:hypothetical protein
MRHNQIVEANIVATHAYQCGLALKSNKAKPSDWSAGALSANDLDALVRHQYALLAAKPDEIKAWVEGRPSAFDPANDLAPILASPLKAAESSLPVNVFAAWLQSQTKTTAVDARAVANLLQMQLDVERDADQLQRLYALYQTLGLPVHTARLGLTASTDAEFLTIGRELAPRLCACPFDVAPDALQMQLRKMWNWGHRYTGERDKRTLACEMLKEPDVAALVPRLKALPPWKIAVIGHSYTMNVHWSSPSASVPIAAEMLAQIGSNVVVRQWQAGGMTAGRADCRKFYEEALAWKPDRALLVVALRSPRDAEALEKMTAGFAAAGCRVVMFDTLYGGIQPLAKYGAEQKTIADIAARTGMMLIPVGARIDAAPDRDTFLSLDGIHMTEPYHRLLAKAWLEYLAGQ